MDVPPSINNNNKKKYIPETQFIRTVRALNLPLMGEQDFVGSPAAASGRRKGGKKTYKCELEGEFSRGFFVAPLSDFVKESIEDNIVVEIADPESIKVLNTEEIGCHKINLLDVLYNEVKGSVSRKTRIRQIKERVVKLADQIENKPFDESLIDTEEIFNLLKGNLDETNVSNQ